LATSKSTQEKTTPFQNCWRVLAFVGKVEEWRPKRRNTEMGHTGQARMRGGINFTLCFPTIVPLEKPG
jgi:hypothetical protein